MPNLLFHSEISVRRKLDNSKISALPSRFQLPSFDCDVRWLLAADFRRRSVCFIEDVVMDDFGWFLVRTIRPYLFCSCISHVSTGRSPESCYRYRGSSCSIPPTFFFLLSFSSFFYSLAAITINSSLGVIDIILPGKMANFETKSNRIHVRADIFHCISASCRFLKWVPRICHA